MKKWHKSLFVFIIVLILMWGYLTGKIYYYSKIDNVRHADAIVVLGASQWNGQPGPVFKSRLDQAYDLYSKNFSEKIILTGGVSKGENFAEAQAGKIYLLEKGIKESDIFMEERGKTSKESLNEVARILKEQNLDTIILVSDGFHMMRIKKMVDDLGVEAYVSPVKDGPINKNKLVQLKYCIRESWVYVMFLIFGI
jgi:uncharacterized SAM-binding protein YcdF (DUF218 family)